MATENPEEGQVEVYLTTNLPAKYAVPGDPIVVPARLARYGLSELVNHMLGFETPVPFDFLVHGEFLRTSLSKYMKTKGITAEKAVTINYLFALPQTESAEVDHFEDWVSRIQRISDTTFVASSFDGSVRYYEEEQAKYTVVVSKQAVKGLAAADTGGFIKVGCASKDGDVRCFHADHSTGMVGTESVGKLHKQSAECVAFNSDLSLLASGGWDGTVALWNADEMSVQVKPTSKRQREAQVWEPRSVLSDHKQGVLALAFGAVEATRFSLISSSLDNTVRVFDVPAAACICSWQLGKAAMSVSQAPDGVTFCTAFSDGKVGVWDIRGGDTVLLTNTTSLEAKCSIKAHRRMVGQAVWCPWDANMIASVSHDGSLKLLDVRSPSMALQTITVEEGAKVLCVEWLNKKKLVTGASDSKVRVHKMGETPVEA
mmetsp:Transcript_59355/g.158966  ORF Transcript_59355/g.158966 Transcript_59355/m.158966 type:complete len:429 (-) Transcript_59355:188-1474(-)